MHLSKTGGGTIRYIMRKQYEGKRIYQINGRKDIETYDNMLPGERSGYDIVAGHFGIDFFHRLHKEFLLFTILRHPIERIISHYHYVSRMPAHEHNATIKLHQMPLMEYALNHHDKDIDNGYVRQLSGLDFEIGQCSDMHLRAAKANFSKYIFTYGFTERFEESLEQFVLKFNWDRTLIDDRRINEAPEGSKAQVSRSDRDRIADKNKFDVALYNWAAHRLAIN